MLSAQLLSDSIIKGIISTLFGAAIALIGEDTITGQFKMTMGIDELESGMALVPLLIGVFVISEVIIQAEKAAKVKMIDLDKSKLDDPQLIISPGQNSNAAFQSCSGRQSMDL